MRSTSFTLVLSLLLLCGTAVAETDLTKRLVEGTDEKDRTGAAIELGVKDPDALALAIDKVLENPKPEDAEVFATAAVRTQVRHIRLLLVWAASNYENAVPLFLDKIDNDHPYESMRACEALGHLRATQTFDRLLGLCRGENELVGVAAARAIGRLGNSKAAKQIVQTVLDSDSGHVRINLTWSLQDILQSKRKAKAMFGRYVRKKGTIGFRAEETVALLEDEVAPPEKYKIKLEEIHSLFFPRGGVKSPRIDASKEHRDRIVKVLADMKVKAPNWHHLIALSLHKIVVSGQQWRMEFPQRAVNLKYADMVKWDRDELIEYYLIRYSSIVFSSLIGDPCEGRRGWREGMMDAWWYAMDHTMVAVDEDPVEFIKDAIAKRPW